MQFSVLMSVYHKDNPQWLKEAVDSVMNNTVKPNEILIGIDGAIPKELEDKLQELSKEYKQIHLVYFKENRGRGAVLFDTLPIVKNPLVAIMDSDDICYSNRFEKQLAIFQKEPNLDVLGGFIEEFDDNIQQNITIRKVPLNQEDIIEFIKFRSPINHVTVMFKKESVLNIGGYSPTMRFAQDYHLWIRAVANKLHIKNISDILVKVRVDFKMFGRRGGYKYFKLNKILQEELLKYKLISYPRYLFNLIARFCAQVILPWQIRRWLYLNILRKQKNV